MTFTDYLFDSVLVLLVLRQVREARFGLHAVLLPLGIIGFVVKSYLHTVPTAGNNLAVVVGLTLVGVLFGSVSALTTRVRTDGGKYALVKAGWVAAGLWVFSMGARFGFAVWASHGGGIHLFNFTVAHGLDIKVWTAAIVLMALGEVLARTGILYYRTRQALASAPRVSFDKDLARI
jgi:hypothetical protein